MFPHPDKLPKPSPRAAARFIKQALKLHGLSQSQVAQSLDMPRRKLTDILSGNRPISRRTALSLEQQLHISAPFLLRLQAKSQFYKNYRQAPDQLITHSHLWLDH